MKALYTLVGMQHLAGADALVLQLRRGEPLTLVREPTNRHDPNCVCVYARGIHVGWIKAKEVNPLAARMDRMDRMGVSASSAFRAILAITSGGWPAVEVEEDPPARSRETPG